MYSAEDYIAMRANANRGRWFSATILSAAFGVGYVLIMREFSRLETLADWESYDFVCVGFCAAAMIYCLVKGFFKLPFGVKRNPNVSGGGGGDMNAGDFGDC